MNEEPGNHAQTPARVSRAVFDRWSQLQFGSDDRYEFIHFEFIHFSIFQI
jgi:hypothetical protein